VTVGLVYRNPLSTLIGARTTPSTVVFQLEIGNQVMKPRIRRAENKLDATKGVSRSPLPVRGCGLFWKFRECRSFRGAMEYSNDLVVFGEDSTDLSPLCRLYYGGVRRNVFMQGDTGRGVVIYGRIGMRWLCFIYTPMSESRRLNQKSCALGISRAPYLYITQTMILSVTRLQ